MGLKDMKEYFPDNLWHMGGDEVYEHCWNERPAIREFMKKHGLIDYIQLQSYWIKQIRQMISDIHPEARTIYWSNQDTFRVKYDAKDIIQYWGHTDDIKRLAQLYPNQKVIYSPYNYLYLDCGLGNPYGGPAWCGDFKTWIHMHMFEPENFEIKAENVLGAEACSWSEINNDDNIEVKLWPRVLGMADTLWGQKRSNTNIVEIVDKMTSFSVKLNEMGIRTSAITGQYCEINSHECFQKW
eukprot:TRINITY_DN3386_c0_g1_i2.p1 TRINITY_DN3386_c0_g1~~TRINITY_DN3386_c0_g1_i2.p1  ORF type:complete len:240 (+),score=27.91 TRINITY_DN3386_c0_g1_i2:216-935(+)